MRCFRVDDQVFTGIHLTPSEGGLCIEVGDETVELETSLSNLFRSAKRTVIDVLKESHAARAYDGERLDKDELRTIAEMADAIEEESIALAYCDVAGDTIVKEQRKNPDALVLVETAPGVNGKVSFKSTAFDEFIDSRSKRVRRKYRNEFPPPGVQVIKEGRTEFGSRCFLLRMMPSSSFRIERSGQLEDAPSVLIVSWKGSQKNGSGVPLVVFSPGRQKEESD